jgi:dephospho-CoA kinase
VVIEVPLLVEAPVFKEMADQVLSIAAPEEMRLARAVAHGRDPADAIQRIRAQASDEERGRLADHVIVNDAGEQEFLGKLGRYWDRCSIDEESRW